DVLQGCIYSLNLLIHNKVYPAIAKTDNVDRIADRQGGWQWEVERLDKAMDREIAGLKLMKQFITVF
ncbi:hypothetical protein FRC03_001481, partial [Tulasnella sp. 419]